MDGHHIENDPNYVGLNVNKGISQPPILNPYLKKRIVRKNYTTQEYVDGILDGNITVLSQAVTLIESAKPEHHKQAQEIIEACLPHSGKSIRIGITGVPGAGKSSLIETLGLHIVNKGHKLGVLAIDPSSEKSKGSILGDKTRMEELSVSPNAFIRPSPSSGSLGGVARKTRETIVLCEAAGFDTIIVETVGVGQSETAVHSMVDFFLLIQLAGTGDELQGIKRGIMEMADAIAINKSDGNNIERAQLAKAHFKSALQLFPMPESQWRPKVINCSALTKDGVDELWEMTKEYSQFVKDNQYFQTRRNDQSKYWMYETIREELLNNFFGNATIEGELKKIEQLLLEQKISPFVAASDLLKQYYNNRR